VTEIRALTVKPPWSHFIAKCGKTAENRSWPTRYRGLLAVHAGTGWDAAAQRDPRALLAWREWSGTLPPPNIAGPLRRGAMHIDFGAVVAVASLGGCHFGDSEKGCDSEREVDGWRRPRCSGWAQAGQYHWELTGIRPLAEPVPCRGKLGLWRLPRDVEAAVRAQMEAGS
jgi:hypothetical protein